VNCQLLEPVMLRSDPDKVHEMPHIRFTLNGKETIAAYEPGMHLLEVLREECGISREEWMRARGGPAGAASS
jgi:hypothetical protein